MEKAPWEFELAPWAGIVHAPAHEAVKEDLMPMTFPFTLHNMQPTNGYSALALAMVASDQAAMQHKAPTLLSLPLHVQKAKLLYIKAAIGCE